MFCKNKQTKKQWKHVNLYQQSWVLYEQMKTEVMLLTSHSIHPHTNSGKFYTRLILSDCDSSFETRKL